MSIEKFARFGQHPKKITRVVNTEMVVAYTRVSSKEQAEKNMSLQTQLKAIQESATRHGWTILESFGGTYESAKSDGRKEFQRMLDFIKKYKGKVSRILVYSVDRFSRTGGAAIKLAQDLREKFGVTVYAVTQPSDTTNSSGVLHQNIQLLFSEYDNQLRKEKSIAGMKHKFQQGIWATKVPQGYDIIKINGERKIVVNEVGKKLRKAFIWKAEGVKNEAIIERLKAMGVPMYKQQLTKIFKRPFYCGIINHGLLDGKVVEGTHEKLISPDIFLQANGIHQTNPSYGVPHIKENEQLPLKVFLKCEQCGQPFTGYSRTKITKKEKKELVFFYYKCRTKGCKCNCSTKAIHPLFQDFLQRYTIKKELATAVQYELEHLFYELNKDNAQQEILLKGQLTEVKKKLSTIQEKYHVLETIPKDVFDDFFQKYAEEKQRIEKGLETCSGSISSSNLSVYLEKAMSLSCKLNTVWTSGNVQVKEGLQNLLFPEGIYYDRVSRSFRTSKTNFIFELIASCSHHPPQNKKGTNYLIDNLSRSAERKGFEPLIGSLLYTLSRRASSTTPAPLREGVQK